MKIADCNTKIVKDFNWNIREDRISYLRDIIDIESRLDHSDKVLLLEDASKEELIEENKILSKKLVEDIINTKQIVNKNLEIQLKSFVSDFLYSLSESDLSGLRKIINYYIKNIAFSDDSLKKANLLAWYYMWRFDSLWDRIVYLLKNTVLLPNVKSQLEFNKQLHWIINRLERKVELHTINHWLIIDPVNVLEVYDNMLDSETYEFSGWVALNWVISNISWECNMWNLNPYKKFEKLEPGEIRIDETRFKLDFLKIWDDWVWRRELYSLLRESWFNQVEEWVFLINSTYDLNILLQIQNPYRSYTSEWTETETFDIEFYAEPKKKLTSEKYLEASLTKLIDNVQVVANMIYYHFGYPKFQNRISLDIENYFRWFIDDSEDDEGGEYMPIDKFVKTSKSTNESQKTVESKNEKKSNKLDFDSIILEDRELEELQLLVDLFEHEEELRAHWVKIPKWNILYWPPGTGKTLSVRIISDMINAHFMPISHTDIESKWVWESEQNLKKKFDEAKKKAAKWEKVILFFDEADSIFEKRWDVKNHKEWIISVILEQMDWFDQSAMDNIFIIFSTNRVESIEWALKERCNKKIEYSLPSTEKRKEHFYLNIWREEETAKEKIFDNIDYDLLAEKTEWKSWRFIAKLIDNAKLRYYLDKIKNRDKNIGFINNDFIIREISLLEEEEKKETAKMWFNID